MDRSDEGTRIVRHAYDHLAAAQIMLTHSWLAITFSALPTPAYIQHFVCKEKYLFIANEFAEADLAAVHDLLKFLPWRK